MRRIAAGKAKDPLRRLHPSWLSFAAPRGVLIAGMQFATTRPLFDDVSCSTVSVRGVPLEDYRLQESRGATADVEHGDPWCQRVEAYITDPFSSHIELVLANIARHRLKRITSDDSREDVDKLIKSNDPVSNVVTRVLQAPSLTLHVNAVHKALNNFTINTCIYPGILELFTPKDLTVILQGADFTGTLQAALDAADQKNVASMRERLLVIGLLRCSEWQHETDQQKVPGSSALSTTVDYAVALMKCSEDLEKAKKTVRSLSITEKFLECWDNLTLGISLDKVLERFTAIREVRLLMRGFNYETLKLREIPVNSSQRLVSVLPNLLPSTPRHTLVLSGESGSGKTFSALALAKENNLICAYMTAWEVVSSDAQLESAKVWASHPKLGTSPAVLSDEVAKSHAVELVEKNLNVLGRDGMYARMIVKRLLSMERSLLQPLKSKPASKSRLVIIVDEAGPFPDLVRAVCSPSFVLTAPYTAADGTPSEMLLSAYLKVEVQILVAGTGVSVVKEKIGSVPDNFSNVVMDSVLAQDVIRDLKEHIERTVPWLPTFRNIHGGDGRCAVLHEMSMIETNARMLACFAHELGESRALRLMRPQHGTSVAQEPMLWQLTADAHYYAELKSCLTRAMLRFKDANGLQSKTYEEVQREIFSALGFSCLHWRWRGSEPVAYPDPSQGVLVDRIERRMVEQPKEAVDAGSVDANGIRFVWREQPKDNSTGEQKKMEAHFVLASGCLHRYSVSSAHVLLAMTMLGVHGPTGTRLGYEAAVCDLISLHTAMALNTTQDALPIKAALPAAAAPTKPAEEPSYNYLFNDETLDPMRGLKELVWNSARELKAFKCDDDVDKVVPGVLVVRTTLAMPRQAVPVLAKKVGRRWIPVRELLTTKEINEAKQSCLEENAKRKEMLDAELEKDLLAYDRKTLNCDTPDARKKESKATQRKRSDRFNAKPGQTGSENKTERSLRKKIVRQLTDELISSERIPPLKGVIRMNEKRLWQRVPKPSEPTKTVPVIPVSWLQRALAQRVAQVRPFMELQSGRQTRVIVIAKLYQDAPGIDTVVAYGTYCCDSSYNVTTMIKLQMKYHEKDEALNDDDEAVGADEVEGEVRDTREAKTHSPKRKEASTAIESSGTHPRPYNEILCAMGKGTPSDVSDVAVHHRLVVFDDTQRSRCDLDWMRIHKDTFAEAMHPTAWSPGKASTLRDFYEPTTQCFGI